MKRLAGVGGLILAAVAAGAAALLAAGFLVVSSMGLVGGGDSTSSVSACTPATGTVPAASTTVAGLVGEQVTNAATIVQVGQERGVPARAIVVELVAGMTESRLRNLPYGDRDSLGIWQMRPGQGWGSALEVTNVEYGANKFYDVLLAVKGWQDMSVGEAAQAVERSGYPDRYAAWETLGESIVTAALGDGALTADVSGPVGCTTQPVSETVPVTAAGVTGAIFAAAESQLGVGYSFGGGTLTGPSVGPGTHVSGFDCSSLVRYAVYQGTRGAVTLPRTSAQQYAAGVKVAKADLAPGDLIFFNTEGSGVSHVGLYLGGGQMLHAPHTGDVVKIVTISLDSGYWAEHFIGITRPVAASA